MTIKAEKITIIALMIVVFILVVYIGYQNARYLKLVESGIGIKNITINVTEVTGNINDN